MAILKVVPERHNSQMASLHPHNRPLWREPPRRLHSTVCDPTQWEQHERWQLEESLRAACRQRDEALAELVRTRRRLVRQERMRELGELASGIVHDFDNSLAQILGFSELLLVRPEDLNDEARLREYVELINTAASDAAQVVAGLRTFYRHRRTSDHPRLVSLNEQVEQAVALTQPKWKHQALARGITITVQTELEDVPPITADAPSLRELMSNLIFNAVDALPNGGTITLRTCAKSKHVILEVGDTGQGMTREVRRRCLEPFFTTKGEWGSGLGLAMVQRIARQHRASVAIASAPGKGPRVLLRLPRAGPSRSDAGSGDQGATAVSGWPRSAGHPTDRPAAQR